MTLIYTHDAALNHVTPPGHPEQVARIEAILPALRAIEGLEWREAKPGDRGAILRCHPEEYIAGIEAVIPAAGYSSIDGDTHVSPGSLDAAMRGVGGICAAVDAVLAGEAKTAFVAMRPPGHHAETQTSMGFCLFGNAAIAAKHALDHHGLDRVAVLDFDVHHGNGTQDLLWNEPRAFFASSHQSPLWPGSGARSETGGSGNVLNVPLAPMSGSAEMRRAWGDEILPEVEAFAPELIIVSAGFDAHRADPLANLNWSEADFTWVTQAICEVAIGSASGRVVSTLEGGYDLHALAASAAAHVKALKESE